MQILKRQDEEVYNIISSIGDIPTFTLSWLLTWYSHVLSKFREVQRLFDAILSQSPLFPLYIVVATILSNRKSILEEFDEDDPHTSLYMVFQRMSQGQQFDLEALITQAEEIAKKVTPESIVRLLGQGKIEDFEGRTITFRLDSPFMHDHMSQMH